MTAFAGAKARVLPLEDLSRHWVSVPPRVQPPRARELDDGDATHVGDRADSTPEATAVTDPGPPPRPSLPSVEAAPPTVLEMPVATVVDMPAAKPLDPDDDPTTTRRGIPKQILEQRKQAEPKPRPQSPRAPPPRVTASEVVSVSALGPRRRPLLAIGIAFVGLALALLVFSWLRASPEPTTGEPAPAASRLKQMFDW